MSAVSTAGISRSELFTFSAKLPYGSARFFRDVNLLSQKLNIDYAESCRMVAERTREPEVRSLLLRMAGSLAAGEDEVDFLRREADVIGETFGNQYSRDVESLKKWADAYVTLLVSSALIVIVAVISTMIYQVGTLVIVGLAMMMVGSTCLGAWIIYASAPREIMTRVSGPSSRLQLRGWSLFKILAPMGVSVSALLLLFGLDLGWVLIVGGLFLFPAGYLINKDDKDIARKDNDIPAMVRVLGGVTSALGTTITEALGSVDRRSMGSLMPEVTRLRYRLAAGIDSDLCWQTMIDETGSEVISRTVQMFWTSLSLGGDPAKVGEAASRFSSKIAFLRATRFLTAATFQWLTFPLHLAMVGLLEFIVEIMNLFGTSIAENSASISGSDAGVPAGLTVGDLFTFGQANLTLVEILVTTVVLVLTGANAFAPKAAGGGHNLKVAYNLSITLVLSGVLIIAVPMFAQAIFASIVES